MSGHASRVDPYRVWIALAAFVVIAAGIKVAAPLVNLLLLSIFIATISHSAIRSLRRIKVPHFVAVVLVLIAVFLVLFLFVYALTDSADEFLQNAPRYKERLREVSAMLSNYTQHLGITLSKSGIESFFDPSRYLSYAATFLKSFTEILSNTFLIILAVFFIVLEIGDFKRKLPALGIDLRNNPFSYFAMTMNHYLAIKTIISMATGGLIGLGLWLLGIDFAFFLGLIAFLFNYIPSIGSVIAAIPAILVALLSPDLSLVVWAIVLYIAVNVLLGNIIEPRIMGKNLGLSVTVVFLSLLFWGYLLGPVGMFLSVPLTMALKIAFELHPDTRFIGVLLGPTLKRQIASDSSGDTKAQ